MDEKRQLRRPVRLVEKIAQRLRHAVAVEAHLQGLARAGIDQTDADGLSFGPLQDFGDLLAQPGKSRAAGGIACAFGDQPVQGGAFWALRAKSSGVRASFGRVTRRVDVRTRSGWRRM